MPQVPCKVCQKILFRENVDIKRARNGVVCSKECKALMLKDAASSRKHKKPAKI